MDYFIVFYSFSIIKTVIFDLPRIHARCGLTVVNRLPLVRKQAVERWHHTVASENGASKRAEFDEALKISSGVDSYLHHLLGRK